MRLKMRRRVSLVWQLYRGNFRRIVTIPRTLYGANRMTNCQQSLSSVKRVLTRQNITHSQKVTHSYTKTSTQVLKAGAIVFCFFLLFCIFTFFVFLHSFYILLFPFSPFVLCHCANSWRSRVFFTFVFLYFCTLSLC